jgi:hypothetical protein
MAWLGFTWEFCVDLCMKVMNLAELEDARVPFLSALNRNTRACLSSPHLRIFGTKLECRGPEMLDFDLRWSPWKF